MNKLKDKLYQFMYGRYGVDELYKLGIIIYIMIAAINIFVQKEILTIMETILLLIIIYRAFSKNIVRRKYENSLYLKQKKAIHCKLKLIKRKWNDRNTHMYKTCPKCKTVLRLPLKKGNHTVKCPTCHNKFTVKCRKNEKIKVEIIKNK